MERVKQEEISGLIAKAKEASKIIGNLEAAKKKELLLKMAENIRKRKNMIIEANKKDYEYGKEINLSSALLDRLRLDETRIESMAKGIEEVANMKDVIGEIEEMWQTKDGLIVGKMRVPLGTIGIIYEARPNVTADAAAVTIKAGNSIILRGGREAINSNLAIVEALKEALRELNLPEAIITFIASADYSAVEELVKSKGKVDLVIIRAGRRVQEKILEKAEVPIMEHGEGNCHIYVNSSADLNMAEEIVYNAKVQRPGVCNAAEKLLVDESIAETFLPRIAKRLKEAKVELRGCQKTKNIIPEYVTLAEERDWEEEYLALIMAIKVVSGIEEAIKHINQYGSHHSDSIVTNSLDKAWKFLKEIDSGTVYVNASTRFTDGLELGLGPEIGISTQKLHARGPMSIRELTTYKFIVFGEGQIRK